MTDEEEKSSIVEQTIAGPDAKLSEIKDHIANLHEKETP
jgi:hypothetical protein